MGQKNETTDRTRCRLNRGDTAAVQTGRYLRYQVRYLGIVPQPSTAVQGGSCETCVVFMPIVGGQPVGDNCNVMSVQNIANLRSTVMWYRSRGVQYDTESIAVLDRSCRVRYDTGPEYRDTGPEYRRTGSPGTVQTSIILRTLFSRHYLSRVARSPANN